MEPRIKGNSDHPRLSYVCWLCVFLHDCVEADFGRLCPKIYVCIVLEISIVNKPEFKVRGSRGSE